MCHERRNKVHTYIGGSLVGINCDPSNTMRFVEMYIIQECYVTDLNSGTGAQQNEDKVS